MQYREPDLDYGRHLDDSRAIGLNVIKESGANSVEVARRAEKVLEEIGRDPRLEGIKVLTFTNQGDEIENTIHAYSESITFARLMWNPRYDVKLNHRLARIAIPTLVVAAEDDRLIPRRHAERWTELIAGARLTVLDGEAGEPTSHLLIIQRPEQLAATVAAHAGQ